MSLLLLGVSNPIIAAVAGGHILLEDGFVLLAENSDLLTTEQ